MVVLTKLHPPRPLLNPLKLLHKLLQLKALHQQLSQQHKTILLLTEWRIRLLDIVVNKKHALPADYAPGENPTAVAQLKKLIHKMQELGYPINNSYSGYRSYEYQTKLYNNYVAQEGKKAADTYSARPGYSEHQTGLAFDILDSSGNLLEGDQYKDAIHWLHTHAHEYGFIVRFQEGKEAITGYIPEAWHLRYVGDRATDIYNSGLSLEEYFGVPGGDYE